MSSLARWCVVVLPLLVLTACSEVPVRPDGMEEAASDPAGSGWDIQAARGKGGGGVPIKGSFRGDVVSTKVGYQAGLAIYRLEVTARGRNSHIGRSRADFVVPEIGFDMTNRELVTIPSPNADPGVITAANGDKIFGDFALSEQVIPIDLAGNVDFEALLTVIGGTGRFAGASGQARAVGRANIVTQTWNARWSGRINY